MKIEVSRLLAIGAHPDDIELGAGATLAQFVDRGVEIQTVVLSSAEVSLSPDFKVQDLIAESRAALGILGIGEDNSVFLDFPTRKMHEHRQEILEFFVEINKRFSPELVLTHSLSDSHQDHQVIAKEASRAFKDKTVLGFDMPWNTGAFNPQFLMQLLPSHMQRKQNALAQFKSQKDRIYFSDAFANSLSIVRGIPIKTSYCEAFDITTITSHV